MSITLQLLIPLIIIVILTILAAIFEHMMNDMILGSAFIGLIALVIYLTLASVWYKSYREADLLNKEFGTSYTAGDIFWTGNIIQKTITGDKIRLETEELSK